MIRRLGIFFLFAMFVSFSVPLAQTPPYLWDHRFGDSNYQFTAQLATDVAGDLVLTGMFSGAVDFGVGPLNAGYFKDVFLARFEHNGNCLWSYQFGDTTHDQGGQCVAVDPSGGIFLAGDAKGSIDFGGGQMTSAGGQDVFLVKFTPEGEYEWGSLFGDWTQEWAVGVAPDTAGNVVFTGMFEGTIDFGGGTLTCVGGMDDADIFLAMFDETGYHLWSKRFGSPNSESVADIIIDPRGNVILAGSFSGTLDFGGAPLVSAGGHDIFVAKLTFDGEHIWSQRFGDSENQLPYGIACDSSGEVLLAGTFEGAVDFGGGPLVSLGGYDIFLARLDADGSHIWSRSFGDVTLWRQEAHDVAVDRSGNVLLTGQFEGTVDFGGGPLVNVGASDIFCARFDQNGNHLWSRRYGDGYPANYHVANNVCPDPWGNAVFAGYFDGILQFGPVPLGSQGNYDIFLVKLIPTDDPTSVLGVPVPESSAIAVVPNPFNPNTTIRYTIPTGGLARLAIYDVHGRRIKTLVNDAKMPGEHAVLWDGRDGEGNTAASGIYFVRLEARGSVATEKLVLLK